MSALDATPAIVSSKYHSTAIWLVFPTLHSNVIFRKSIGLLIYIIRTPNIGSEIVLPGQERDHDRFLK